MTTDGPAEIQPLAPARGAARIASLVFHDITVSIFCALMVLATLCGAGAAMLTDRLFEIAHADEARQAADFAPTASPSAMAEQALDFTLSPGSVKSLSYDQARIANAAIPLSTLPIQAARPFIMTPDKIDEYARALDCLTAAIYYEAASETGEGQTAVAQVVLNRMRHPAYPKTVCGVVFQGSDRTTGCQFSFTCDGAMDRPPSQAGWLRARAVAGAALNGSVATGVGMATHYHTDWVAPYWAPRLVKMRQIGTHIFYRWPGSWGLRGAFTGRHPGAEPIIAKMAPLASLVEVPELEPLPELESIPTVELTEAPRIAAPAQLPAGIVAPVVPVAPPPPPVRAAIAPPPPAVMANPMQPASGPPPSRRGARIPIPD